MNDPISNSRKGMHPSNRVVLPAWRRGRSVALAAAFTGLTVLPLAGAAGQEAAGASPPSAGGSAASRKSESGMNWDAMLQTLMTSPGQRELMGNLKELIRKGDMAGAQQLLASAVDMGTIAIVVTDHVEDPALLASLDKLGVEGQRPPASQAPASAAADTAALEKSLAELKASLEQERNRADAASREARSVQEELAAAKGGAARTAELEAALTKAREQAAAAARNLHVTGASDFHGSRKDTLIGAGTTSVAVVDAFEELSAAATAAAGTHKEPPW